MTAHARLRRAAEDAQRGDCASASKAASELGDSDELDEAGRRTALSLVFLCTRYDDPPAARHAIARAERLRAAWVWPAKFWLAADGDDATVTLAAFDAAAEHQPAFVRELDEQTVGALLSLARSSTDPDAAILAVLERLAQADFRGPSTSYDGWLALEHVRLLLQRGEVERARARLPEHISPELVQLLRARTLFAPLRGDPQLEAKLDYLRAAEEATAIGLVEWKAKPSEAAPLLAAMQALRALGRPREAIEVGQRGLEVWKADPSDDASDAQRWILNEIGYAHYELSEPDLARAALERSARFPEYGTPNVSQVINWASELVRDALPEQALAVIETVGSPSPYGRMWAASIRACANEQLGRIDARNAALEELRAEERENPAAHVQALLCANRLDEAAASMIRRLAKPELQDEAFAALHEKRPTPAEERPFPKLLGERFATVCERPDVRAAAAPLGTIESIPLTSVYWGSY